MCFFVFFKQKTAYEMRISDWSSDVCSSDLHVLHQVNAPARAVEFIAKQNIGGTGGGAETAMHAFADHCFRCPHRRIGELFGREISLHAPPPGNGRSRKYQRDRTRGVPGEARSEEHTSELQSLMRISYAVFCLKKKKKTHTKQK